MVKEVIEIQGKVNSDEVQKEFKNIQKEVNNTAKATDKFAKDGKKDLKTVEKQSKKTSKGVKSIGKGFKVLGTAMKAAGIGLIIALVAKLTQAFSRNQKVMDTVNSVFETVNIVMSQIVTAVTDAFDAATKATGGFDALSKVMQGLLTLAITPLKLGFFSIKLGIQEAQLAFEKSYFGDKDPKTIKELNASIRETRQSLVDTGADAIQAGKQVVENFGEAVGEIGTLASETTSNLSEISISAAKAQADALVQSRNQAEINAALIEKSIFQSQLLAEKQRQIRDDETKSFKERREANEELGRILQEQQENELKLAQQRLSAAQQEVAAGNTSVEAKVGVINAEKELLDIKERIAGFESEQQANRNAINREEREAINAQKQALSELDFQKKRAAAAEIENERVRLEALKEIAIEEREFELERLQNKLDDTDVETQARIDAEIELAEARVNLNDQVKDSEKKLADFKDQKAKEEKEREQAIHNAKVSLAMNGLQLVAEIAGKGSKIAKAVGIAQTTLSTIEGVQNAYTTAQKSPLTTVFPAYPVVQAGLAAAFGVAQIAKLKSTQTPSVSATAGASGGGSSAGAGSVPQAQAPSFNVVGDSGTNQIADVLGENANKPQRAYVVSKDVSSQQELDRNVESGSSLG